MEMRLVEDECVKFAWHLTVPEPKFTGRWKVEVRGHYSKMFLEVEYTAYPGGWVNFFKDLFGNTVSERRCRWVEEDHIEVLPPKYEYINKCGE